MTRFLLKKIYYSLLICALISISLVNAQEVRVIDNKGTIAMVRNNQVTTIATAPITPLEGDVWFDTSTNTSNIYTGAVWVKIDIDKVTSNSVAPVLPVSGDIWLDTSTTPNAVNIWDGNSWLPLGNNFWSRTGNSGTNSTTDFAGTIDAQDFVLKSNNIEKLRLFGTKGQVLINQAPTFNDHPLVIRANGDDVLAFQDAAGTPKWHWNLLGNGLNFVESEIADFRLFLENGGNVGINTGNPEAMLDINTTAGSVPFKIEPNATTPVGASTGQMFVATDGILYVYDGVRGKWLSASRFMVGWGRNSNASNEYLRQFNGSQSSNNGWRMMRDGTITGISAQTAGNETWTLQIRRNDLSGTITSISMGGVQGNHLNNINVDVSAGDFLQAYCSGNNISNPQGLIEIAWRK